MRRRLWRIGHPGSRLLPVRQQAVQQSAALRSIRDFVEALIREARDIDEYAFALGALAHYANDNTGHPAATNRAVPLIFPKIRTKFGETVIRPGAERAHHRRILVRRDPGRRR
jgi:hypothetical protein